MSKHSISVTCRSSTNIDLFVVSSDGRVYTSWWSAGSEWSAVNDNWKPLGGFFPKEATVSSVSRTPSNLDLFVVGNDGRVYTSWWSAGSEWSGLNDNWKSIGGFFPTGAAVSSVNRSPENLDLFVIGNDGRVYTSWWGTGSEWSGVNDNWRSIGGFFPKEATVSSVSRTPGNLDLFVVGNDGKVFTSWWSGGSEWSGINDNWRSIGGLFPTGAAVSSLSRTPGNLDLFIVGSDGRVYTSWWSMESDWNNNWLPIGGFFPVDAAVSSISRTKTSIDLFVVGNDGRVYTSWWSIDSGWSGTNDNWMPIGGFFPSSVRVSSSSRTQDNIDLFVAGNDGKVYTSWWSTGSEWSGINDNWKSVGEPATLYSFYIDSIQCDVTRARSKDTVHIALSVAVGNRPTATISRTLGRQKEGFFNIGMVIPNVFVNRNEIAVFSYVIVNDGHKDDSDVRKALEAAASSIAKAGASAAASAVKDATSEAVGAIAGAAVGAVIGSVVPVLGTIVGSALGSLAGTVLGNLFGGISPDCDGPIGAAVHIATGADLQQNANNYSGTDPNPGIDSPFGCGKNSEYHTTWSVRKSWT